MTPEVVCSTVIPGVYTRGHTLHIAFKAGFVHTYFTHKSIIRSFDAIACDKQYFYLTC